MSISIKKLTKEEAIELINSTMVDKRMPKAMIEAMAKDGWVFADHYAFFKLDDYEVGIEFCIGDFCIGVYRENKYDKGEMDLIAEKKQAYTAEQALVMAMEAITTVMIIQRKLKELSTN